MKITKQFITNQYWKLNKNSCEIAKELGVPQYVIGNAFTKFGIKMRNQVEAKTNPSSKKIKGYKWCPMCKTDKRLSEFNKNKNRNLGVDTYCRKCVSEKHKKFVPIYRDKRESFKMSIVKMFGNRCSICDTENLPICCYQFHHKNPSQKNFDICRYFSISNKKLQNELSKCVMVCSNCHLIIHYGNKKVCS